MGRERTARRGGREKGTNVGDEVSEHGGGLVEWAAVVKRKEERVSQGEIEEDNEGEGWTNNRSYSEAEGRRRRRSIRDRGWQKGE